jgi:hypothetical protein
MQHKWYYTKYAEPYLRNKITIPPNKIKQVQEFVKTLVPELMKREKYKKCERPEIVEKSYSNGLYAEVANSIFIDYDYVNFTIKKEGDEELSDLSLMGLNIGVKTVKRGNGLPLVYNSYIKFPEIISVLDLPYVYIIGYSTIHMLKYYNSRNYVWGDAEKNSNKRGFWGFHKVHEFKTLDELKKLYYDKNLNSYNNFCDTVKDYPTDKNILVFK